MKKLQSTDYIFIIGLVILLGIAGTIIFLIMSAETYEKPSEKDKTDIISNTNDESTPGDNEKKPPVYKTTNDETVLNDTIVWAPYRDWEPAPKYTFESKYKITGVVTDINNVPLENAEVGITPLSVLDDKIMPIEAKPYTGNEKPSVEKPLDVTKYDLSSIAPAYKTRTNNLGQYEFPYFTGYYVLFVKKQFYYEQKILCNYDESVKDFKLDRWGTFIGRVLDTSGQPIQDYIISVYKAKSSKIAGSANLLCTGFETENFRVLRYTFHVRNMKFGMHLPEGLFDVVVTADKFNGRQISAYKIEKNKQIEENFILFGNTMLKGKVTVKGKPEFGIEDVAISLQENSKDGYRAVLRTRSDKNGDYYFDISRPGNYTLTAVHELFKVKKIDFTIKENQTQIKDIELDAGTYLHGLIHDEDGNPIEYASIEFAEFPNQNLGVRNKTVKSKHDGVYVVPELKPGTYRMKVLSKQFFINYVELVTIAEGENTKDVELKRGVEVRINLVANSPIPPNIVIDLRRDMIKSPLPMIKLSEEFDLEWSPADPNYSGRTENMDEVTSTVAVISGVYPGSYIISIRDDNFVEINEPIEIPENTKKVEKTINISSGYALGGTVKDDKGNIVPTAFVRILLGDKYVRTSRVNQEGKFFVQGLGDNTYTIRIEAREYIGIEKEIKLTSSLTDEIFVLGVGEILTGVIKGSDGNPIREGIGVKLYAPPRGEYERYPITRTDKDGKFEFKGLNKGKFKIEIIGAEGVQADNHEVQVPGNVVINMTTGIKISGTITDFEGKPVNRATIVIRRLLENPDEDNSNNSSIEVDAGEHVGSTFSNENGDFEIIGLEAGYYEILVIKRSDRSSNSVYRKAVNLTSDYNVNIILEKTYEVSGTIKFTNGNIPMKYFIRMYQKNNSAVGNSGNINGKTGEFIISGLNAGAHVLELISHYSQDPVYKQDINVPVSKPLNIVVDEIKMFKVTGKIVDEAGESVKYPRLQILKEGQSKFNKFWSGKADGSFEINDLLPGVYTILVLTHERKILTPIFKVTVVDKDIEDLELKAKKVIQGVYVKAVRPGANGQIAGLQSGDIIIEYNGVIITDGSQLDRLSLKMIGKLAQVSIKILRDGTERTLMIEPGEIGLTY